MLLSRSDFVVTHALEMLQCMDLDTFYCSGWAGNKSGGKFPLLYCMLTAGAGLPASLSPCSSWEINAVINTAEKIVSRGSI